MTGAGRYWRIALGAVVIAGLIVVPLNFNRYGLFILSQWAVMTIAAMGLNLTLGYAGQVSLAQGAFVGIGAYAAAIMTSQGMPLISALGVAVVGSILASVYRSDIVHRLHLAERVVEGDPQAFDPQDGLAHALRLRRGLAISSSPTVKKNRPRKTVRMITVGAVHHHHQPLIIAALKLTQ